MKIDDDDDEVIVVVTLQLCGLFWLDIYVIDQLAREKVTPNYNASAATHLHFLQSVVVVDGAPAAYSQSEDKEQMLCIFLSFFSKIFRSTHSKLSSGFGRSCSKEDAVEPGTDPAGHSSARNGIRMGRVAFMIHRQVVTLMCVDDDQVLRFSFFIMCIALHCFLAECWKIFGLVDQLT